jgi:hypothetical protein
MLCIKMLRRIKNSVGWRKRVIFRKKTGTSTKVSSRLADGNYIEHVVYNSPFQLSARDLIGIKSIVREADKRILKWLKRPNCRMFAIKLNGEIAHFCLVTICKKSDPFKVASKDDISIGPCNTPEKHRRKGLYKANLEYICSNWKASKWAYVYTRVENIPSQKGIAAAGFERMGVYKFFSIGRFNVHIRKCSD